MEGGLARTLTMLRFRNVSNCQFNIYLTVIATAPLCRTPSKHRLLGTAFANNCAPLPRLELLDTGYIKSLLLCKQEEKPHKAGELIGVSRTSKEHLQNDGKVIQTLLALATCSPLEKIIPETFLNS